MTEDEAKAWLDTNVSRETLPLVERFIDLLREENRRQNLVSAPTLDQVWSRHVVDSLQLLQHAPGPGSWVDVGSGAGFPGLLISLFYQGTVTLIEERKLRAAFLERAVAELDLSSKVHVLCANAKQVKAGPFDVISARAFAPLDRLFATAAHLGTETTRWVLPKGRNAKSELDAARASWQGVFRLEPSVTDAEASIIVADRVRPRKKGMGAT